MENEADGVSTRHSGGSCALVLGWKQTKRTLVKKPKVCPRSLSPRPTGAKAEQERKEAKLVKEGRGDGAARLREEREGDWTTRGLGEHTCQWKPSKYRKNTM